MIGNYGHASAEVFQDKVNYFGLLTRVINGITIYSVLFGEHEDT